MAWDKWYLDVVALGAGDSAEDMQFLETVGQEFKAQGVSFAAQWELPLNDLHGLLNELWTFFVDPYFACSTAPLNNVANLTQHADLSGCGTQTTFAVSL